MADYAARLKADLIMEFKGKPVIEALMDVIGDQLTAVYTFFEELKLERSLDRAIGRQLDNVGDIVCLTRKEAGELACLNESVFVLEDADYRNYLIYKVWRNTNNCTYYDIITAFRMFWPRPIYYREDPERPATMIFESDELTVEDDAQKLLTAPFVKAGGVGIFVIAKTATPMPEVTLPIDGAVGPLFCSTTLPEMMKITVEE